MTFRKSPLAALPLLALIAGCNDSPTESSTSANSTTTRALSPALKATCKPIPAPEIAARATADDRVTVKLNRRGDAEAFIYDSLGRLVVHSQQKVPLTNITDSLEIYLQWDGRDTSGRSVPIGHYFQFWTLKDSLGATLRKDSACVGIVPGGI